MTILLIKSVNVASVKMYAVALTTRYNCSNGPLYSFINTGADQSHPNCVLTPWINPVWRKNASIDIYTVSQKRPTFDLL